MNNKVESYIQKLKEVGYRRLHCGFHIQNFISNSKFIHCLNEVLSGCPGQVDFHCDKFALSARAQKTKLKKAI